MSGRNNVKQQTNMNGEEYDFCNVETGKTYKIKWSPPQEMKLMSQNRYCTKRDMSKSAIRKGRVFTRQRISKSLNFDAGRTDRFKTPSSGSLDQFSRSAKIMRALNFNSCPGNNSKRKSVTKVLNFDMTPSSNPMQSPASNFSTSSPIDSIHLSIGSSDSHATSIDENQNQTPSHQRKSAKKALDYLSPQSDKNQSLPRLSISPVLRSGLKKKIDSIIQISDTPNVHSLRRIANKPNLSSDIVNTSRNLYYDFERECSDTSPCPSTPKNTSKPIPESMSAIKKSHRKERLSKRFEDKEIDGKLEDDNDDDDGMHLLEPEDMTTSPRFTQHLTPNNRVSIVTTSPDIEENSDCEDNVSETGSLFNYRDKENIEEQEEPAEQEQDLEIERELMLMHQEEAPNSPPKSSQNFLETPKREKVILKNSNVNSHAGTPSKLFPEPMTIMPISNSTPLVSRKKATANTPENDPSVIPDIISSSIKKSHRKVKEENRKRLLKPTALHTALMNSSRDLRHRVETADQLEPEDRPTTPENLNSSRLLLPQFDSVKKSHKKEKHKKKLPGYARYSMLLDAGHLSSSTQSSSSDISLLQKNLFNDSTNSQAGSASEQNDNNFPEMLPLKNHEEQASSPSKKMKISEGESVIQQAEDSKDDFQIFTPLRKRRTQLMPADEPSSTNTSSNQMADNEFVTPVKGKKRPPKIAVQDVTPEDRLSTMDLVKDFEHSIKKSHRKDKLAARQKMSCLNRSLNISFNESLRQNEFDDPQPSTSRASNDSVPTITPPNCLKTKSYLHAIQTSSIKKLHKQEREKRRSLAELSRSLNESSASNKVPLAKELQKSVEDPNLSDDGSIFSGEDRLSFMEIDGAITAGQDKVPEDNNEAHEHSFTGILDTHLSQKEESAELNQSYEGSIFDENERLESMDENI